MNTALDHILTRTELYEEARYYSFLKRVFDIVCSFAAIIALSPLFLVVAVMIKLESKGPVFFIQTRCGRQAREFQMLKFRSMIWNAEMMLMDLKDMNEQKGPVFKIRNDPRITRVGKFLRRTSIDELPQLFNILKGDMSFVGPRPPIPAEAQKYSDYERQKMTVKPGLTCYWQIMGRNSIEFQEWIELDIKYIRDRSLWLDITLVLKTFKVFLGDENAS